MKNGYKIIWSIKAHRSFNETIMFLEKDWTIKEVKQLVYEVDKTIQIISDKPNVFQETDKKNIRRAVVLKLNSIFYHVDDERKLITILSFFNNRQDPKK
jgi:plasmid stabilization system protein ParE